MQEQGKNKRHLEREGAAWQRGKELCEGTRLKRIEQSRVELFYIMMVDMHRGN